MLLCRSSCLSVLLNKHFSELRLHLNCEGKLATMNVLPRLRIYSSKVSYIDRRTLHIRVRYGTLVDANNGLHKNI